MKVQCSKCKTYSITPSDEVTAGGMRFTCAQCGEFILLKPFDPTKSTRGSRGGAVSRPARPGCWVPDFVSEHPDAKPFDTNVFCALDRIARGSGSCFPSQDFLAKEARCSERSVFGSLRRLRLMGAIRVTHQYIESTTTPGTWLQTSNLYELALDEPWPEADREIIDPRKGRPAFG